MLKGKITTKKIPPGKVIIQNQERKRVSQRGKNLKEFITTKPALKVKLKVLL